MESSELKRLQEALRESDARYQRLIESVTDYVYTVKVQDGRAVETVHRPGCGAVTGYRAEEYAADPALWYRMVHEQDRPAVIEQADRLLLGEAVLPLEHRLIHRDGSIRWVRNTPVPHYDSQGNLVAYDGLITDITEQKQAEEAVRESEARYRAIVEAFDGLIYVCSQDYRVEFMNERFIERTGYDGTGAACYKALHDLDSICPWCVNERVFKGETVRWEVLSPKDNRWYDVADTPLYHADGSMSKQAMILDITERKQAEEALRESEERYRAIYDNSAEGILLTEPGGGILAANSSACGMLGWTEQELRQIGREGLVDLSDPRLPFALEERRRLGKFKSELTLVRKDGTQFLAEVSSGVFKDKDGNLRTSMIVRDVTERKSAEEARLHEMAAEARAEAAEAITQALEKEIAERTRIEEALTKRLVALTEPLETTDIAFTDLFDLEAIQKIQNTFAEAMRVASIITHPDGTPITQPSNFCRLCMDVIRKTDKGRANCFYSDSIISRHNAQGPIIQPCLSGGLWDAGASITLGGKHVANWLIGQVKNEAMDEERLVRYASEIGADEDEFRQALQQVPVMSNEQFDKITHLLFLLVNELSLKAYQNIQQARFITERKRAEEALRESEARLRALIDNLPFEFWVMDSGLRYIMQNAASLRNYGNVVGMRIDELGLPAEVVTQWAEQDTRVLGGKILREEYEREVDGQKRVFENLVAPVTVGGAAIGIVGVAIDVTEHKRAAAALNRRAVQLALINDIGRQIAAALDIAEVLDRAARLVQQNFGYQHVGLFILNSQCGELLMTAKSGDFAHLYPAHHRVRLGEGIVGWTGLYGEKLLANDVSVEPHYINFYPDAIQTRSELSVPIQAGGKNIGVLDVQSRHLNAFDEDDTMVIETLADQIAVALETARLYEAIQRELTERRRAEEALRRRNEELVARNAIAVTLSQSFDLDSLLHATLDTVLEVIDLDVGWIQLLNEDDHSLSLVAHRGFTPDMVREIARIRSGEGITGHVAQSGQRVVLNEAGQDPRLVSQAARSEGVYALAAVPIMTKDKVTGVLGVLSRAPRQLSSRAIELLTAVGHQIGLAIENVRLARQASEIEILREVDRLRGELLANISHELKTPLGLIKVFCGSLLEEDVEFDRATQREFLSNVQQETEKLEDLVNNLLDLSRIQDGRLRVDKCPTDLAQLAREIMQAMEFQSGQHPFVCDFAPDPLEAMVDPNGFAQVLRNLLSNAIKYSPAGGTIIVQGRAADGCSVIRVSDQGIGIPAEELDKIFERFYRVENEVTRAVRGAGLGLAVCRGIVEAHGGRIWAESAPGLGSTLCVTLPADPAGPAGDV